MNNLKYYEDGLAYDFSMFAPAEKISHTKKGKIIDIPDEQKKRSIRRRKAASGVSGKVSAILATVFIIGMLSGNIFLRSQITETEHKIAKMDSAINLAESKLASVNFKLDQKLSYNNLEQAATALGMRKLSKSQIIYIKTNQENKAVLGEGELSAENN
jgi:cell division protein FtsL